VLQLAFQDKIDILAVPAASAVTVSENVLEIAKRTPTSVLVWRDLVARTAQLEKMKVTQAQDDK
jgi:hypothetical protein